MRSEIQQFRFQVQSSLHFHESIEDSETAFFRKQYFCTNMDRDTQRSQNVFEIAPRSPNAHFHVKAWPPYRQAIPAPASATEGTPIAPPLLQYCHSVSYTSTTTSTINTGTIRTAITTASLRQPVDFCKRFFRSGLSCSLSAFQAQVQRDQTRQ